MSPFLFLTLIAFFFMEISAAQEVTDEVTIIEDLLEGKGKFETLESLEESWTLV